MSDATVRGKVHVIEDTKTFGQNNFRKRLVVLEQDGGRFTNYIPIDFIHEGCDSVDELSVGDDVEIAYKLSGRKWQRDANSEVKFFLNAEATSFEIKQKSGGGGSAADDPVADEFGEPPAEGDDDVPF